MRSIHRSITARLGLAGLLLAASTLGAQESDTFNWKGDLGSHRTIYLRNVNGGVRIEPGSGRSVEVTAVKRWRRGDPQEVRIEARISSSGDVIICALFRESATCDESGYHGGRNRDRGWRDDNDVSVEFIVKIPADARVDASTVNGELRVEGTSGEIRARTTNGDVEALSSGSRVEASTVNGSITVRSSSPTAEGLQYETVNGSITIEMPASLNAEVDLRTVNGQISSDFPMTLEGSINPRRIRASIGSGGPTLRASTVNGSIRIRKL